MRIMRINKINKKADVEGVTDFFSYLAFVIIVLLFLLLFNFASCFSSRASESLVASISKDVLPHTDLQSFLNSKISDIDSSIAERYGCDANMMMRECILKVTRTDADPVNMNVRMNLNLYATSIYSSPINSISEIKFDRESHGTHSDTRFYFAEQALPSYYTIINNKPYFVYMRGQYSPP